MKTINHYKAGSAADVIAAMQTGYAQMVFADKTKRYEFTLRELPAIGTNLTFGDYGEMSEEEELTYAEVWETQQKFDHKVQRAFLEPAPAYRGDTAGSEIVDGFYNDDDEVQK